MPDLGESSRPRRLVFWLFLVAGVLVVVEGLSLGVYRLRFRGPLPLPDPAYREELRRREEIAPAPRMGQRLLNEVEVIHPYLGFARDPDAELVKTTEYGFPARGAASVQKRSEKRLLIGVFGGSVAESFAARWRNLARELQEGDLLAEREIVVIPYAMGGYKQPQQLMALAYLLTLGGELDVAINLDGYNEITTHFTGNGRHGVFPAFPRSWSQRVSKLEDPTLRALAGGILYLRSWKDELYGTLSQWPLRHSPTVNLLWRHVDLELARSIARKQQAIRDFQPAATRYVASGPRVSFESEDEVYGFLVDLWVASSLQMHRLCRANDIRYFHFLQPNQYVDGSKPMGAEERAVAIVKNEQGYQPGTKKGYPMLIEAGAELRKQGVSFFDLTRLFEAVEEPVYSDDCCHLNGLGDRIQAREIARAIQEHWN